MKTYGHRNMIQVSVDLRVTCASNGTYLIDVTLKMANWKEYWNCELVYTESAIDSSDLAHHLTIIAIWHVIRV